MSLLANRYAQALHDAARRQDAVDAVGKDLLALQAALAEPETGAVVLGADTPATARRAAMDRLGAGRHVLTQGLLRVVDARRRQEVLPELAEAYAALVRLARGEIEGVAECAHPLASEQLAQLEKLASAMTRMRVKLTVKQVDELIGGVRLRLGNTLFDGSVATALAELETQLMAAPLP